MNFKSYNGNIVNDINATDNGNYKENRVKKKLKTNLHLVPPNISRKNKILKK